MIADQALVAGAVLAGDHRRLIHPVQPGQRGLDLAEFDAIAADLDLFVGAPEVVKLPVGTPADKVAGAIHPRAGRRRTGRQRIGRRSVRRGAIPDPHAAPGEIQLADHPGRYWTQPIVEDEERGSCHR